MNIPITKPFFDDEEFMAVQLPLKSGWVVQGKFVKEFEEKFSAFTGARFSIATTSCSTAMHVAVTALGLKPGEEVIVPAFTWVSTANVVEYMHAKPVFCDIDLDTFNIDTDQIEHLITPKTVGIIPVHLFGLCADMNPILEIAKRHKLWVLEDAACAFGASYSGRHAGTFGELGCFSFHPRKSITTGEGGMITTNDSNLDELSRIYRDHGASRTDFVRVSMKSAFLLADFKHLGYNYRMTDIQGALGCVQLKKAEWILAERSRRARIYDEMLRKVDWLEVPKIPDEYVHGYQAYVCLFRPEEPNLENLTRLNLQRNELMAQLETKGIATRQGTHAPVIQDYYADKYGLRPEQFPNAYLADRLSLTLPLYVQMAEAEQDLVISEMRRTFQGLGIKRY
jgi:dTDP-4-amino-4,6-dideoxygalactose transaminase